ncbi:MAG: N-acetylmuramoyl-L-alanine amidase, partial [Oscillospiraceae bacterium]|nr:N-acetylmuramoyl-L-alanine amidase [Oscillospiraceae bacterium]
AKRMQILLEGCGVSVALTRADEHTVTLERRVKIDNEIQNLNLFVSLHSNAAGTGGWVDSARGYVIYTSQAGQTAGRNIAAQAVLKRAKAAGILIRGSGLAHSLFYVLRHTTAPAVLIEHGFHTSREDVTLLKTDAYRQKLAEANAWGICGFLGVGYGEATETSSAAPEQAAVDAAVDALSRVGIITAPGYWKAGEYSQENVQHLLVKSAAALLK